MIGSRYEKYVVNRPAPPDLNIKWGRPELGIIVPNFFLSPAGPIKESNAMVEFAWIVEDCVFGVTQEKPPHKHDCDEVFLFIGINPKDTDDLGAEVEFWLGEGEETEKIRINTSALVFVPKGLLHLPLFFKNVKRPLLWEVVGLNIGDALKNSIKYPVRGL